MQDIQIQSNFAQLMEQNIQLQREMLAEMKALRGAFQKTGIQKDYELLFVMCTKHPKQSNLNDDQALQIAPPGYLWLEVSRKFVLLDTFVVDNIEPVDAIFNPQMNTALNNMMCYLQDHPAIYLANFAKISSTHTEGGKYPVLDHRKNKTDVTLWNSPEVQFCVILQSIDQS